MTIQIHPSGFLDINLVSLNCEEQLTWQVGRSCNTSSAKDNFGIFLYATFRKVDTRLAMPHYWFTNTIISHILNSIYRYSVAYLAGMAILEGGHPILPKIHDPDHFPRLNLI
jgi:hypothetical protein